MHLLCFTSAIARSTLYKNRKLPDDKIIAGFVVLFIYLFSSSLHITTRNRLHKIGILTTLVMSCDHDGGCVCVCADIHMVCA